MPAIPAAILEVQERTEGRSVERTAAGSRYTRSFFVHVDPAYTHEVAGLTVESAVDPVSGLAVPVPGALYAIEDGESSDLAACVNVSASEVDGSGGQLWQVTAQYDTASGNESGGGDAQSENPLERPPTWSVTTQTSQESYLRAVEGWLVRNTARDPIDGLARQKSISQLRFSANRGSVSLPFLLDYKDKVNDADWLGVPKDHAFIAGIGIERHIERGEAYYVYTLEIQILTPYTLDGTVLEQTAEDGFGAWPGGSPGWQGVELSRGYRDRWGNPFVVPNTSNGEQNPDAGNLLADPVLLDSTGFRLGDGASQVWVVHTRYERANFAALGIDLSNPSASTLSAWP